ncbi:S-layer homology domain-containing protein [Rossellomorea vietnamensis]|uniref:S-layer homology domain-containing protein n=1 Tax=Rossellomorea vietnamensis TaxID=218284 RepID=UPI001653AB7D|nr:S-layer homology domain-containing protein [Rossellomorea vietnamensis]
MRNIISLLAVLALIFTSGISTSAADMNCSDFSTWKEAQDFFESEGGPESDSHGLDRDGNGLACESLPGFDSTYDPHEGSNGIFTDTGGYWAEEDINLLYNMGIVSGLPDGSFGIKKSINRAEAAAIITRHLDLSLTKSPFNDVPSNHWANTSIGAVAAEGMMSGYKDGSFQPNEPITRAEVASMLERAYELTGKSAISFTDISSKHWAYGSVQVLVNNGITSGYPDNTFKPKRNVSRSEFASFAARIIRNENTTIAGGEIAVSSIDVGQGDSILLETSNGNTMLIDGGHRYASDEVISHLHRRGVSKIDLMINTHPDADHLGGLIGVLETFPVGKVIDSGKVHTTQTYNDYLTIIDEKNIPFEVAQEGQYLDFDENVIIQVLNSGNDSSDLNESSIVLKVIHEDVSILLTGDATIENEMEMMQNYNVDVDVLKVGHHGSDTSSSKEFIRAVSPDDSIISYGDNSYGHPDSAVVQRLNSVYSEIWSTYHEGSILLETGDNGYSMMSGDMY